MRQEAGSGCNPDWSLTLDSKKTVIRPFVRFYFFDHYPTSLVLLTSETTQDYSRIYTLY